MNQAPWILMSSSFALMAACSGAPTILESPNPDRDAQTEPDAIAAIDTGFQDHAWIDTSSSPEAALEANAEAGEPAETTPTDAGACAYVDIVDASVAQDWGCWRLGMADPAWVLCTGIASPKLSCKYAQVDAGSSGTAYCCPRSDAGP